MDKLLRRMRREKHASVWPGFFDELKKLAVSEDEALDAAKKLTDKGRARRYAEGAAIGGAVYPLTNAAGEAAKGFVEHGRAGAIRSGLKALSKPEAAKSIVRGAMGGTTVQGIREGLEVGRAKDTYKNFMQERGA